MIRCLAPLMLLSMLLTAGCAAHSGGSARTFTNPIIPGFHPDPSICRVGDDYYLVNSSFEFFPGVPIFHSRDLVHWKQIGHCLSRKSQLNLDKTPASAGIFAPTLRYHDGTFYMVTTHVNGGGNFFVTAQNPAGPWSDPVWLKDGDIDPSLFFDDDGTVYYTRHQGMTDWSIVQSTLDLKTGKLQAPPKEIWKGTGDIWPEGPHLYKINGIYYLMIAEGGTSYGHNVTIARSASPWGPFEPNPNNPILTHRRLKELPIQATGHADMVETPDGWWMVFLGIRPQPAGAFVHHLGRETFLAPVTWTAAGWPVVNGGRPVELSMPAPNLPEYKFDRPAPRDNFDSPELALQWNFLRNPYEEDFSVSARPGWLRLSGSARTINEPDSPAFVARRQTDLTCRISTAIDFIPTAENEEAGLVIRGNEKNHYTLGITRKDDKRKAFVRKVLNGKVDGEITYADIPDGITILTIQASPLNYEFYCRSGHEVIQLTSNALTTDLSSEKIGGFTGVYIGMYASGNGKPNSGKADFDWYEYNTDEK
jgi:xylan 1,4-beta-xylosidase